MTSVPILAWHFVGRTLRDGRPVPPDGTPLTHTGNVVLCRSGLHASTRVIDALLYAPGATLCRVALDGVIQHAEDKLVASQRTIIWRVDAAPALWKFARWCALSVVDHWDMPPVVREYLDTGHEDVRDVAWDFARIVMENAPHVVVSASACSAMRAAAQSTAWAAAVGAAREAAGAASWAAVRCAARNGMWNDVWVGVRGAQEKHLTTLVWALSHLSRKSSEVREGTT